MRVRRARVPLALAAFALALASVAAAPDASGAGGITAAGKRATEARIRERVAAAEDAMRAKHDARISAMEASAALARETEARLTEERDDLARDVTRYKRGLLHLEAKRKAEAADATGRERALQASLDEALDAALEATRSAKVARDEAKRAKRESAESWARARKHHRADDPDEASETTLRQTTPARLLASLGARAARTATTTRDAAARVYARAKTRVVAAIADAALGATDAREAAPSRADEAVAAAVVAAAAAGALAAALAAVALAALVRSDRSNRSDRTDRSGLGRAPPDARKRPAAVAADRSEASPTKASIAAAAAAFDANPETFVLAAATGAGTTGNRAEVQPAPSSPATPAAAAGVNDGALKSALKRLASALGTPRTPAAGTRDAAGVESSPVLDLDAHSDDLLEPSANARRVASPMIRADAPKRAVATATTTPKGAGVAPAREGAPGSGDSASSADAAARGGRIGITGVGARRTPRGGGRGSAAREPRPAPRTLTLSPTANAADAERRSEGFGGGGGRVAAAMTTTPAPASAAAATPRHRAMAYSERLRRGLDVEIPALRETGEAQVTSVAGGAVHARAWEV